MLFYVDKDIAYINEAVIPASLLDLRVKSLTNTSITVFSLSGSFPEVTSNITSLEKKDGSFYLTKAELIKDLPDFFFNNKAIATTDTSIFPQDVDFENSDFSEWTGDPTVLFESPFSSAIENLTTDNPKSIIVAFNRTQKSLQLGLGDNTNTKFSNVKISLLGSGGAVRSIYDQSANNTKTASLNAKFENELFNSVLIEFYTADPVRLSNITIQKSNYNVSQIEGVDDFGVFHTVKTTPDGNFAISDESSGLAIARGLVSGTTFIHKFGEAPNFDFADGDVIMWDGSNNNDIAATNYTYSTIADIDSISSTSIADSQNIEIQGVDANYVLVTQTATLNGQNRVALSTPLLRVFRLKNISNTDITGFAYCYVNTALTAGRPIDVTKIRASIKNGDNQTLMAVYTVPAGKTAYLRDLFAATSGAKQLTNYVVTLKVRPFGQVFQTKYRSALGDEGTSYFRHEYVEPEVIQEKSDIEIRVKLTASNATDAAVSGGFDIVLIDNI